MPLINDKIPDPPDPRVWESARHLVPELADERPAIISDGGGLPFTVQAAFADAGNEVLLDQDDPRVAALLNQIDLSRKMAMPARPLRPREKPAPMSTAEKLAGWRILAENEDEVLFGRGRPPRLLTSAARRLRRGRWQSLGATNSRPLRAVREGVRASSWRIDPTFPPEPDASELRVLLTEQTRSTGSLVSTRLLTPEIYYGKDTVIMRMYVRPLEGYVGATMRRIETPVVVELPQALGSRVLRDGGVFEVEGAGLGARAGAGPGTPESA